MFITVITIIITSSLPPKKERFVHVRGIKSRKAFLGGSLDPVGGLLDLGYTTLSEAHTAEAKAWPPRATSKLSLFDRNKHMGLFYNQGIVLLGAGAELWL